MTIKNLAIIMDGNGRWAKQNKLPIKLGHSEGVKALKKIVKAVSYTHLTLPTIAVV